MKSNEIEGEDVSDALVVVSKRTAGGAACVTE